MKKKTLKKNNILKYIFIVFVSLTIFCILLFLVNILNRDYGKEKAEQEIKDTVNNWANASFNIGDFDNFSTDNIEKTEEKNDGSFNVVVRKEACKNAVNYLDLNEKEKVLECNKSSTIISYIGSFYNVSKLEDIKINKITLNDNKTEATAIIDLSIDMKIAENLQTDYVENAKLVFDLRHLKTPLNFYDLSIDLKKENDVWKITNDKKIRNNLYQLYALYIDEKSEGNMIFPEIDKWSIVQ